MENFRFDAQKIAGFDEEGCLSVKKRPFTGNYIQKLIASMKMPLRIGGRTGLADKSKSGFTVLDPEIVCIHGKICIYHMLKVKFCTVFFIHA